MSGVGTGAGRLDDPRGEIEALAALLAAVVELTEVQHTVVCDWPW